MGTPMRIRKRLVVSPSSRLNSFRFYERLEPRTLLCASVEELVTAGVPESMIRDDGHISYADYINLEPELRAHVDPHMVEVTSDEPLDYDKILGIPSSVTNPGGPEAEELPDFFPQISGGFSLDKTSQSGRTLLRFGTQVNNQGNGPGILLSGRPGVDPIPTGAPITSWVNPDGSQNIIQAIYNWNGSSYSLSSYRAAGQFTYHPGHGHFHFDGYAYYRLRHNNGGVPGDYVQRGDGTGVVGEKVGFCLINLASSFTMENGQSSATLPGWNKPGQPSTGCGLFQGIHVGEADIYSSGLEGQWIDVTDVPNGNYFVEIEVDGENAVAETNDANNAKTFAYTLNTTPAPGGITPDLFEGNDTLATAHDIGEMGKYTQTGLTIHWGQDWDFFRFTATSTGSGTVATTAASGNVDVYLYDSAGEIVGSSTRPSGVDTVTYNFVAGETYYVKAQSYNSTVSSNYQIAWNINPTIGAVTTDDRATETGNNNIGVINVARNGPVSSPLDVNFTVGGTATRGVDYDIWAGSVLVTGNTFTIGNEAASIDLEIRAIADGTSEPAETVEITLASSANYAVGAAAAASVIITDGGPEVQQAQQVWQTAPHKLIFNVARADAASIDASDITIENLDVSQTVTPQSVVAVATGEDATVTVTFNGTLPDGNYRATLLAAGVTDDQGNPMAADYVYDFFYMTADADHDGKVDLADFNILANNFGQSGRDVSTGDFNFDGVVNLDDFNLLSSRFGTSILGSADSTAGRGTAASAFPRTSGADKSGRTGSAFSTGKAIQDEREPIELLA